MKTLVVFTGSYPFPAADENTFLPQELAILKYYFSKIILVPADISGKPDEQLSTGIIVDTTYGSMVLSMKRSLLVAIRCIVEPRFWLEVFSNPKLLRHPMGLVRAAKYYALSMIAHRWVKIFLSREQILDRHVIFYTWWFDYTTLGVSRFADENNMQVVTRAHGIDLYENRHVQQYIPFRIEALRLVSLVLTDSLSGARYLISRYPVFQGKVGTSLLGVIDPGFSNMQSSDGVFRIVSCSFMVAVKRLDLLIDALSVLGLKTCNATVQWIHFGDGPERERLVAAARAKLPINIKWAFPGYPGNKELFRYYKENPADVFVNVSRTEGTPVSIMEAISVGIPVVATAVGGNVEIVSRRNGILLNENPDPVDIANALELLMYDKDHCLGLRRGSKELWESMYNAGKNYKLFAETVLAL